MLIRNRNALGRQNDKKEKGETTLQTVEQTILKALRELRGGCYRTDCILQEFMRNGIQASPEQIADVFNSMIIAKQIRLLRIKHGSNGTAAIYFTVLSVKTKRVH